MASKHRKFDLLDILIQGIRDDDWNVIYLSDPKFHPFQLRMYRGSESYKIRVYIWNLTHGGGVRRPEDEYRIQITGTQYFENKPDEKTLILGWWSEGEVLAGFDYTKHTGQLGFSPSIQIRKEALKKAHLKGISFWEKGNQEIAIALRPDFLGEYIKNLESLHSFGESETDYKVLTDITEESESLNNSKISGLPIERQVALVNVRKKIRDNGFKSRVLRSYSNQCAFCGLQLKLVNAAHIVPVQHDGTDETSNGISLCALHHRAFDRSLVTFDSTYEILYNASRIDKLREAELGEGSEGFINGLNRKIHLPLSVSERPHTEYVNLANKIRGW